MGKTDIFEGRRNADGVPYCKIAPTFLEKDGEHRSFKSQSEVDQAWADGWYEVNHPETAQEAAEDRSGSTIPDKSDKSIKDKKSKSKNKDK